MSKLNWGFVGCGAITNDFCLALYRSRSPRHRLVAAASKSSLESAQKFAKRFNMSKSYGTYEELFADPEINAVYIGNLNSDHMETALVAIKCGKAVLIEKPMTMCANDSAAVFAAARDAGVLAMEAMWSRFNPTYARIRKLLETHTPLSFMANFTVSLGTKDRVTKPELGGGAIFDIGIYAVQLSNMLFGYKAPPEIVQATGVLSETGCDVAESISLRYANGGISSILIDARCCKPAICEARIFFKNGSEFSTARILPPFWAPEKLELTRFDGSVVVEHYPLYPDIPTNDGLAFVFEGSQGLAYEAEGFADAFEKWQTNRQFLEHPLRTHNDTLMDAKIMDTVIAQLKAQAKSN